MYVRDADDATHPTNPGFRYVGSDGRLVLKGPKLSTINLHDVDSATHLRASCRKNVQFRFHFSECVQIGCTVIVRHM
jgi:hypothetical protein